MATRVTATYEVGALVRRSFRRVLLRHGIRFTESKGLLDSEFFVTASTRVHEILIRWGDEASAELATQARAPARG